MKKLLKQPFLWISVICFLIAVTIAGVGIVSNQTPSVISKLESGINRRNAKRVISCYSPEMDEVGKSLVNVEMESMFALMDKKDKIEIIAGPVTTNEDGEKTIEVFMIGKNDKTFTGVDSETLELVEVKGKLYLAGY